MLPSPVAQPASEPPTYTVPSGPKSILPMPVQHQGTPSATPDQAPIEASLGPGGMNAYNGAVFSIESGNDPNNVTGKNYGLGQFSAGEYGITAQNWRDPRAQQRAMQMETAQNIPRLRQVLGRDPTPAELYIAHQQGPAGGPALLAAAQSNPSTPAWQVVSRFYASPGIAATAISNNLPDDLKRIPVQNITAGQFVASWKARFNRAYVPYIQRQPQVASVQ